MNKTKIKEAVSIIIEMEKNAIRLIKWMGEQDDKCLLKPITKEYYIDENSGISNLCEEGFEIEFNEYWAYGGHQLHGYSFPLYAFYDEDRWKNEFLDKLGKKQSEVDKKNSELVKRKEELERKKYEELKAKYGN